MATKLTFNDLPEAVHFLSREVADLKDMVRQLTNPTPPDTEPFGDFHWLRGACPGIPASTLRIKSAAGEIPGTKKIGKRVLYDKAEVLNWIRAQSKAPRPDAAVLNDAAEAQIDRQLAKRTSGREATAKA
jgi:hypothetical protein